MKIKNCGSYYLKFSIIVFVYRIIYSSIIIYLLWFFFFLVYEIIKFNILKNDVPRF